MPADELPRRRKPCAECPWKKETPPGQFEADRYAELRKTTIGEDGYEASIDATLFACHRSPEGGELACAGWLAAVGHHSLRVRLLVAYGQIPAEALDIPEDWPELFLDYDEMAERQGG